MSEEIYHHHFDPPLVIPTRTTVTLEISEGCKIYDYKCIDCGYATYELERMREHQEHQERYHGLWVRLRRRFKI